MIREYQSTDMVIIKSRLQSLEGDFFYGTVTYQRWYDYWSEYGFTIIGQVIKYKR